MIEILHRYPGAQPFGDNELSRRTFFGRDPVSVALTDQILASRLVVVYAKSGLGKTSLLNAGVAPRLREAGYLPLFVRVNDIRRGPLVSVYEGIRAEASRQHVEYVEGEKTSLWAFFKSAEFWREDFLLTPVLILDQFEEMFTLQTCDAREQFLSQLAYLVRGIPPPSPPEIETTMTQAAPAIRVVLSLREDYLGVLEEASDRIPEILDHRFRVPALTREMAAKAITGPAAIEDSGIASRAFRLEPSFVQSILDYLTRSRVGSQVRADRNVEPFHLQLICQRIETAAAFKQKTTPETVLLNFKDFGGEPALAITLESFYAAAIGSLPAPHLRRAAQAMCEQLLISPDGQRLSVEGRELRRALKLPRETLDHLVDRRLLRTDRRSDQTYYELSHDALVQPVLSSRRLQALTLAWLGIVGGLLICLSAGSSMVTTVWLFFESRQSRANFIAAVLQFMIYSLIAAFGFLLLRNALRRRKRYGRHTERELARTLPTLLPFKDRALGWTTLVGGSCLLILGLGTGGSELLMYVTNLLARRAGSDVSAWLHWVEIHVYRVGNLLQKSSSNLFAEMSQMLLACFIIVFVGWVLLRMGARKLWPHRFTTPDQDIGIRP
jgi:hypothetical protein